MFDALFTFSAIMAIVVFAQDIRLWLLGAWAKLATRRAQKDEVKES